MISISYLGEKIHHGSYASLNLTWSIKNRTFWKLCLGPFSGLCLQWEKLKGTVTSPTGQRAGLLLLTIKSPSSAFFSCTWVHCVYRHPSRPFCITSPHMEPRDVGNRYKNEVLDRALAVSNKLFCFAPSSPTSSAWMHPWKSNRMAYYLHVG